MIWILAILIVVIIYNKERMPDLVSKFKKEMPNIVDAGKKMTKELKQKAQANSSKKSSAKEDKTAEK